MPFPSEFKYTPDVSYPVPPVSFGARMDYRSEVENALTHLTIAVSETETFKIQVDDIFQSYTLRFNKLNEGKHWWHGCDMKYWQNQLNFAVWCASAGCGVSWEEHLNRPSLALILGMFRFHVYFQTRKILQEMSCPLPGDDAFNAKDNHINKSVFKRICREFNISSTTDFRAKIGPISGMGTIHTKEFGRDSTYKKWTFLNWSDLPRLFQYIQQSNDLGWVNFIPRNGKGFTQPGIQRINDSIRAYVYCVLGAQAQTRSAIVGDSSTAFDAQKQFLSLLRDSIHGQGSETLVNSIKRYQDAITNTHSQLDYAIGPNLYLIPSNMILNVGSVARYNNSIQIASDQLKFGVNDDINQPRPPKAVPVVSPTKINRMPKKRVPHLMLTPKSAPESHPVLALKGVPEDSSHTENKVYLALGLGAVVGLGVAYFKP